jgi:hypothetical protein
MTIWHEVTSMAGGRRSAPVRTPPLVIAPEVSDLRACMDGDGVALSWTLMAGYDDVLVERAFDASSSFHGTTRQARASGGRYVDRYAQTGATYRYRVRVSYPDPLGALAHTPGVDVVIKVIVRPRPVIDLEADTNSGMTTLRWTTVPGALVRIYATDASAGLPGHPTNQPPGDDRSVTDSPPVTGPFGPVDEELPVGSLAGREHLVGSSRRGRLTVTAASGPVVYTPISIAGTRAVVGRSTHHLPVERIHALQAVDRGNTIVLTFQMPPGITEARVLWRHDTMPTGPDDQAAQSAKVTNTSLEIRGGWHLNAPDNGLSYHFAVYPLVRSADGVRALPTGAQVVARVTAR